MVATAVKTSIAVIINPGSGSVDDQYQPAIEAALKKLGADYSVYETSPRRLADCIVADAIASGATQILVCGGDGTVMGAVNGIAEYQKTSPIDQDGSVRVVLSIVPGGTANLLAAALKIPIDIDEAVAVAVNGVERDIDLGRCGEQLFALGLGLGLTEKLVSQTSAKQKEKLGKAAYAIAMLREMGAKPTVFTFKLDNGRSRRARGVAVVVANAGEIGGGVHFAPNAKMDDAKLDLCILHRFYLRDFVRMAWLSLRGKLPEDRAVSFFQAKRIEIRSQPPLDLQIDGEVVHETTPLVAEVLPGMLRVKVPPISHEP